MRLFTTATLLYSKGEFTQSNRGNADLANGLAAQFLECILRFAFDDCDTGVCIMSAQPRQGGVCIEITRKRWGRTRDGCALRTERDERSEPRAAGLQLSSARNRPLS